MRRFELNKKDNKQQQLANVNTIYISIPYYNEYSILIAKKITKLLDTPLKKIRFGFKSQIRISTLFNSTYKMNKERNQVIYQYDCQNCKGSYIGKTSRGMGKRKNEHKNAFKEHGYSKIAEHCINKKHKNNWNGKILAIESNGLKRHVKESLLMNITQQKTNRTIYSQESYELNIFG